MRCSSKRSLNAQLRNTVVLSPKGLDVYDSEGKKTHQKEAYLFEHLWSYLEVKDIRVRDILRIANYYPEIWSNVLGEWALPHWSKLHKTKAGPPCKRLPRALVHLSASIDTFDNYRHKWVKTDKAILVKKIKPKVLKKYTEFALDHQFSGLSAKGQRWALDLSPIENWIDAKLEISKKCSIETCDYTDKKYPHSTVECNHDLTVMDVFKAIFYEITFCGTPKDSKEKSETIQIRMKDYKSGKAIGKPIIFQ